MMTLVGASAGRRVFVGFNDIAIEGEYVWVDGVMFTNTTANLWSPGEPSVDPINRQMADCGTLYRQTGNWLKIFATIPEDMFVRSERVGFCDM